MVDVKERIRSFVSRAGLLYVTRSTPLHKQLSSSMSRPADNLPSTARAIALLLSSAPSVQDAQPGVLHQLLEFAHRYTTQVLTDASVYAEHANRGGKIELEDITLAVQARVGWEFGGRVPKEVRHFCTILGNIWDLIRGCLLFVVPVISRGRGKCCSSARGTRSIRRPSSSSLGMPYQCRL